MAGRRPRSERDARRRAHSQNFLHSSAFAADLVADADIAPSDLVLDIGAGSGTLTTALARVARHVVAVELDPVWSSRLRERFARDRSVTVVEGDVLTTPLPDQPFRVFASLPFARTTPILRRLLDDPRTALARADVIVQWEVGSKRILLPPRNALTIEWSPWWKFSIARRLSAECFRPVPSVDAALLAVERRRESRLEPRQREPFVALVREGFARPQLPLRRALGRIARDEMRRALRGVGTTRDASAGDLSARQWVDLYRSLAHRSSI